MATTLARHVSGTSSDSSPVTLIISAEGDGAALGVLSPSDVKRPHIFQKMLPQQSRLGLCWREIRA